MDLEKLEELWENELRKWASILENLDEGCLQKISKNMLKSPVFSEIVASSPELRKKLLSTMI